MRSLTSRRLYKIAHQASPCSKEPLEGLTDKDALCSGNCSEQFYTDATRPPDLSLITSASDRGGDAGGGSGGANGPDLPLDRAERPC
jgi:hypothetical protein